MRILSDGVWDGKALSKDVLYEFGREDFALVRDFIVLDESRVRPFCICCGNFAIEFIAGDAVRVTLAYHHGKSIRHPKWIFEGTLKNRFALTDWLKEKGLYP